MIFELLDVISTSALLIIAFFIVYQYKANARQTVKKNTYEQLYKTTENRQILTKVLSMSHGREFDADELLREDEEFRQSVYSALNYCEFLAIGIYQGVLDEEMVKTTFGSLITAVYLHFERFIKERRMHTNNPETFRYFSQLVEKWRK